MENKVFVASTFASALGSGMIAGVFFAFSTSVMTALGRAPPPQGIATMQSINVVILNPLFLGTFLGTAALCMALAVYSMLAWNDPGSHWLLAGSLLYFVGSFLVTMACNVPMNNALAAVTPSSTEGADLWRRYLINWTRWNHIRAAASIAATACFIAALR